MRDPIAGKKTLRPAGLVRAALSLAVSLSLVVLSPGLEAPRIFAQAVLGAAAQGARAADGFAAGASLPKIANAVPALALTAPAPTPAIFAAAAPLVAAPVPAAALAAPAPAGAAAPAEAKEVPSALRPLAVVDSRLAAAKSGGERRGVLSWLFGEKGGKGEAEDPSAVQAGASASAARPRLAPAYADPSARKITDATFVVFDIETTGFNAEVHATTQVGAVKVRFKKDGTLEVVDAFQEWADPKAPIPAEISDFTDITGADVRGAAELPEVLKKFRAFAGEDSVLVAHNAPFDTTFLSYRIKEEGLAPFPHLVLDTKDVSASLFPGLASYSVAALVDLWKLGGAEQHNGMSDSMQEALILGRDVARLAETRGAGVSDLTVADLAAHSAKISFASVLDSLAPRTVEPERLKPLPDDYRRQVAALNKKLHAERKPAMLRDIAYEMGVPYEVLRDRLRADAQSAAPAAMDAVAEELRRDPPAAALFDYDGTLADDGAPAYSVDGVAALLKAGMPVGLLTGRSLDAVTSTEGSIPTTLWDEFVSKIPAELRRNLFFSGSLGAELAGFDEKGKIERYLQTDWDAVEKPKIEESVAAAMAAAGLGKDDASVLAAPGRTNLVLNRGDARAAALAAALTEQFRQKGLPYRVYQHKEFVTFAKSDKGGGARLIYAAMRARGFPVDETNLLIVGDDFKLGSGTDSMGALAFPRSRALSVGNRPDDLLPPNVRRVGVRGPRGTRRIMAAAAQGFSSRPAAKGVSKRGTVLRTLGLFAAGAAAAAALPWLFTHALVAGIIGSVLLAGLGLPQIVKNFRQGAVATQDLPLKGFLFSFGMSSMLLLTSILKGSSIGWVLGNAAGVIESAIIAFQINRTSPKPGAWMKSFGMLAGTLLAAAAALAAKTLLPAASVAMPVFVLGMVLLYLLPLPQMRFNYDLWTSKRQIPEGVSLPSQFLILGGGLFSLLAAVATGDVLWMINNAVSLSLVAVTLGQLLLPGPTNALLGPIFRLMSRKMKSSPPEKA